MFKVLVVDDDNNIRAGLKVLVPWEKYGFEIIESAADGIEALDKYKEGSFDLIVVDMQMPKMGGLEFISIVRKMDPLAHFMVLSGHADFKYAQKSIDWRVDGYILKPIDEDELIEHLKKIGALLKKEQEERLFNVRESILRCEMLIQSILSGSAPEDVEGLEKRAELIGLSWPSYRVLLIEQEVSTELEQITEVNIRRRLKQAINNNAKGIVFRYESFHGILLNNSIIKEDTLQHLYDELAQIISRSEKEFFIAIGEPVNQIIDIDKSYKTAVKLLKNRFIADNKQILSKASIPSLCTTISRVGNDDGFDVQSAAGKLYYALDVGNIETIKQLIDKWDNRMLENGYSENAIKTNFMQIISTALNKLYQSDRIDQTKAQELLIRLADIFNQNDINSLKKFIFRQLEDIIGYLENGNKEVLVKKIVDIIERNYNDNLTLEMLSDSFNYSSAYLGKLFKKHTRENFNSYLNKIRILKAKEFLLQGKKVYQVAIQTGFSNVDYFFNKFKKHTGVSPSQFRKDCNLE
jgi:two-component system, response regulator YesN